MSAQDRSHGLSPYRHALDAANEALLAAVSRAPQSPESSVSISRNAKGVAQFEVVVRGVSVQESFETACAHFAALETLYPYPLEGPVSPQEHTQPATYAQVPLTSGGRSRARRKPEAA